MRADQVLERFNWTLQCGPDRHTPDAAPLRRRAAETRPDQAVEQLYLRVERQTISRLPGCGGVLFTIRVCLDPAAAIAPADRPSLAAAWRGLGARGRAYKGWDALEPLAEAVFERWSV